MENQKERITATKSRILFLLRYLFENTDDEHAVSTNELIAILAENGFSANRKTVRDDVECELKELVRTENFSTVIGTIVDVAADESVLGETRRADAEKLDMVLYDSFSNSYFTLGEKVGKAWGEGKKFLK